jgi:hypothetical protein
MLIYYVKCYKMFRMEVSHEVVVGWQTLAGV